MLREAQAVDKLSKHGTCEHLVHVIKHAWLPESPYYYIDMELCEISLEQYIQSKNPLTYDLSDNSRLLGLVFKERGMWNVWDIMEQISEGMRYIHASEQVHRDLKPRNGELTLELELIVVSYSGMVNAWKIADFGLTAEGTSKQAHTTRYSMGTPCYRAPELMREHAVFNNKVDIFAMGCLLFELVTGGRKAFANDFDIRDYADSHATLEIPKDGIDERWRTPLSTVLTAMLDIDSTKRPSAETLREGFALKRFISLGDEFKERGEPDKAIVAYQNATELNGDDSTLWRFLGNLYIDTERYEEAIIAYNSAMNAGLPQSSIASGLGVALLNNQDYDGAIEKFKLATTMKPSESSLWSLRGDAHLAKGDINAAINMFKKATKRKPVAVLTYEKLGKAYCLKGDIDKAMNWYTLALKYHSSSPTLQEAIIELIAARKAIESQDSEPIRSGPVPTPITRNTDSSSHGQDSNTSSLISSMMSGSLLTILRLAEKARLLPSITSDSIEIKSAENSPTGLSSVATSFDEFDQIEEDLESTCDIYSGETISKGVHLVGLWRHAPQYGDEMSVHPGDIVVVQKIYQDGWALGYKSSSTVWTIDTLPDNAEAGTKKRSTILKIPWAKRQDNSKEPMSLRFPLDIFCHGKVWKNVYSLIY